MRQRQSNLRLKISEAEYQRFAEQFVDGILDSRQPWLVQYLLAGGFSKIPTEDEINSGDLALGILSLLERDWLVEQWKADAFRTRDRPPLVAWIKETISKQKRTKDEMSRLLACVNSKVLKRSLKALQKKLAFRPGANPKLPADQYSVVLGTAELLEPAISQFLAFPKTSRSLGDTLHYLKKDHPKACEFLNRYVQRFHQALDDPALLQRAKKNTEARARVLAQAMAGSDYDLSFSTSRERVRQARRLAEKTSH